MTGPRYEPGRTRRVSAGPLSRRPEKRHTRVGSPGSTETSSGAAVKTSSTSGTNPDPDIACIDDAARRELADGRSHPATPARVDRLSRLSRSRRCMVLSPKTWLGFMSPEPIGGSPHDY